MTSNLAGFLEQQYDYPNFYSLRQIHANPIVNMAPVPTVENQPFTEEENIETTSNQAYVSSAKEEKPPNEAYDYIIAKEKDIETAPNEAYFIGKEVDPDDYAYII